MVTPDERALERRVQEQYERFPFPDYTKAGPAVGTAAASLANADDPARLNAVLFGGCSDPASWTILVAGGGTGEKTLGLALLTRPFATPIVHLDLSARSLEVASRICRDAGVTSVEFVHGSIYEIPKVLPGRRFDYIQCMGVLHHLPDPQAGLDVLAGALTDRGALSLAVYADVGRTAVYLAKEAMSILLEGSGSLDEELAVARAAMASLPRTNWLWSDTAMMRHLQRHGDNALIDAILHAQDVAYDAHSFRALLDRSGLTFVDHCEPFQKMVYDLRSYDLGDGIRRRLAALPELRRKRFLELFHGRLVVQSAYAARGPLRRAGFQPEMIPHRTLFATIHWGLDGDDGIAIKDTRFGGIRLKTGVAANRYLASIDDHRCNGEILDEMIRADPSYGDREALSQRLESELSAVVHYDLVSFCDRPFRRGVTRRT